MRRFLAVFCLFIILSCQEEITPILKPNTETGGNTGGSTADETPVAGKYANCLSVLSNTTFDIVTWNIENFPKEGATSINLVAELILAMDADIIAVQEIASATNFATLMASLPGYASRLHTTPATLRQGFIYKTSEITDLSDLTPLFTDDLCAFPRPALKVEATHVSGQVVTLINLHLKCCDDDPTASCAGGIDRRRQAATKLKSYIDTSLPNTSVIVLGDYNEDITQPFGNEVFTNFVNDATNYKFADMAIAQGGAGGWSYPSWPSHLDHILITNELFSKVYVTKTIPFNNCESGYYGNASDHRPVMIRLNTN
jgi:endonuclease/exonuclease/phosphatase family metal-dependent hydrolase